MVPTAALRFSFAVRHGWQAEQRAYRDMLTTCILLLTFALYVYKTVPLVCALQGQHSEQHAHAAAPSSLAWSLVCGHGVRGQAMSVHHPHTVNEGANVQWLLPRMLQVLAAPWLLGWLMGDWVHIIVPGMRALVLAVCCGLLPLPLLRQRPATGRRPDHNSPNESGRTPCSSSAHTSSSSTAGQLQAWPAEAPLRQQWRLAWVSWEVLAQQPELRNGLVVVQRLMRPLAAAASAVFATVPPRLLHPSILGCWDSPSQYVLLGWTAALMTVPPRWQVVLGGVEWLLTLLTTAAIQVNYFGAPMHRALTPQQVLLTLVVVWVVPALASCWLEPTAWDTSSSQCKDIHQQRPPLVQSCLHAASKWFAERRRWLLALTGQPGSRVGRAGGPDQPAAGHKPPLAQQGHISNIGATARSSGHPTLRARRQHQDSLASATKSGTGSLAHPELLATPPTSSASLEAPVPSAAAAPPPAEATRAQQPAAVQQAPLLWREPGGRQLAQRGTWPAAPQEAGQDAILPVYRPVCRLIPSSVKVYAPHQTVHQLAPTLFAAAHAALSTESTSTTQTRPVLMQAACFPGCVQLLSTAYWADGGDTDTAGILSTSSGAAGEPGHLPHNDHLNQALQRRVIQFLAAMPEEAWPQPLPAVVAAVDLQRLTGSSLLGAQQDGLGSDSTGALTVGLACMEPVCAVAGAATRMHMWLDFNSSSSASATTSLSSSSAGAGGNSSSGGDLARGAAQPGPTCRLLVFDPAGVVVDECHPLDACIRFELPALLPGTHHVALLPTTAAATPQAAAGPCCQSCAPLVMAPLLVLPSDAAAELQGWWQEAAAAGGTTAVSLLCSNDGAIQAPQLAVYSRLWQLFMSGLLADLGYMLALPGLQDHPRAASNCSQGAADRPPVSGRPHLDSEGCAATRLLVAGHPTATVRVADHLLPHLAASGLWAVAKVVVEAAERMNAAAVNPSLAPASDGYAHGGDRGRVQSLSGAAGGSPPPSTPTAAALGACGPQPKTSSRWLAGFSPQHSASLNERLMFPKVHRIQLACVAATLSAVVAPSFWSAAGPSGAAASGVAPCGSTWAATCKWVGCWAVLLALPCVSPVGAQLLRGWLHLQARFRHWWCAPA